MERQVFIKHNFQTPSNKRRVDRFVFPRETMADVRRRRFWHAEVETVDIWDASYQKKKNYRSYLDEVFGMKKVNQPAYSDLGDRTLKTWPCVPRKRRCMAIADCMLDLPSYNSNMFPDLLDWGPQNVLVAALGYSYHMFGWVEQDVIGRGIARNHITSCKFDPRGEFLLLGTEDKGMEIHSGFYNKLLTRYVCPCTDACAIATLDWTPTGNSFVIGCSSGMISSWTVSSGSGFCNGSMISKLLYPYSTLQRVSIISVKVSPDSRYVAAAAVGWQSCHVLLWPHLQIYCNMFLFSAVANLRTLTWHSWRSALLGVGADCEDFQPRIALWDVPSSKIKEIGFAGSRRSVDTMLFSHRTGELVLSLWDPDEILLEEPKSALVVMSDATTVVDHSNFKTIVDRIRTMVFNPDGTKLATASEAEDLTIWNFLPQDNKKNKSNANTAFFDKVTKGFVIR